MKRILCVVLVLVFATIISSCNGNNNKSFNDTLLRAESGNPVAQYNLGLMYSMGVGVKQNYQEALNWFLKAANQGVPAAQYNLGLMYFHGEGVKQNKITGKKWFSKACDNGHQKGCDI